MGRKNEKFVKEQVDKLFMPWEVNADFGMGGEKLKGPKKEWLDFILNFTKRTEAGNWNEKYGVMVFKANYGYHSAMKKIVDDCVQQMKKENPDIVVMDESDDNRVRTWTVGKPDSIKQMVEDELKSKDAIFVGDDDHELNHEWVQKKQI